MRWSYLVGAGLALVAQAGAAQAPAAPRQDEQDIVVHGFRPEPYVPGRPVAPPPHCVRRPGDPLDAVEVGTSRWQRVIAPDRHGVLRARLDDNPITGPDVWQRAGNAIPSYVFRSPNDGSPLCIGARGRPDGWGQLRQILDARPLYGKTIRFTAFVATRDAAQVRLWLAAANSHIVLVGGDTQDNPLTGTHGWTPISLMIRHVPHEATILSYGFLLFGTGDLWITQPKIEVLDAPPPDDGLGSPPRLRPHTGH